MKFFLALKIHISPEVNEALNQVGGYEIKYRGLVDVKGKGLMKTYWLISRNADFENGVEKKNALSVQ